MMNFVSLLKIESVNRSLGAQALRARCRWNCVSKLRTFVTSSHLPVVVCQTDDRLSSQWRRRTSESERSRHARFQSLHGRFSFSVSAVDPFRFGLTANNSSSSSSSSADPPEKNLSLAQRLKKLFKDYSYVIIPVHMATSCVWFAGFYYLACSGINLPDLLHSCGISEKLIQNVESHKGTGNVIVALALYKIAMPLRYMVTLGVTTLSLKYLTRWGWIKPVPNKKEIQQMYEKQKGALKDLKEAYQDKIYMTKNDLLKTKKEVTQHYKDAREGLVRTVDEGRKELIEGVKLAKEEWKHAGKLFCKEIKKNVAKKRKD